MILRTLTCAALLAALTAGAARPGNWEVESTAFGVRVVNSETNESISAPSEKAGRKMAKKLNRIEDKQSTGVFDDGSGACDSPIVFC